jgi:hypothetical protein
MGPQGASGHFLDEEFDPINSGQGEMLMHPKKDPLFQYFPQFLPAGFQRRCLGVNPLSSRNFTIIAAIIGQNFIFSPTERRLYVFQKHALNFS